MKLFHRSPEEMDQYTRRNMTYRFVCGCHAVNVPYSSEQLTMLWIIIESGHRCHGCGVNVTVDIEGTRNLMDSKDLSEAEVWEQSSKLRSVEEIIRDRQS